MRGDNERGDSHPPIKSVYELCLKSGGIKQLRKAEAKQRQRRKDPQRKKGQKRKGKTHHWTQTLLICSHTTYILSLQKLLLYPPQYRHKVPQIRHNKKYIQYDCSVLALRTGYLI